MISFCTSIYGDKYIPHLYVLLQSIDELYGDTVEVCVAYSNLSTEVVAEVKSKIPHIRIVDTGLPLFDTEIAASSISRKMNFWLFLLNYSKSDAVVFLDVDTVVVKPINGILQKTFDLLFTYKTDEDENLRWPINTGVVMVKRSEDIINLVKEWTDISNTALDFAAGQRPNHHNWGGIDQYTLGKILGTREIKDFAAGIKYKGLLLSGIPCKIMNETRCVFTEDTRILHFKGLWHKVLTGDGFNKNRPKDKCLKLYTKWKNLYRKWVNR